MYDFHTVSGTSVSHVQHLHPYPNLQSAVRHTPTRHFCEFCTFIPVLETSGSSVCPCHNTRRTGTTFVYLPGTFVSFVGLPYRTRNIWEFCTTSVPVPLPSASSVRHSYVYPKLLQVIYARATIPGVRGQHSYTYPELVRVL